MRWGGLSAREAARSSDSPRWLAEHAIDVWWRLTGPPVAADPNSVRRMTVCLARRFDRRCDSSPIDIRHPQICDHGIERFSGRRGAAKERSMPRCPRPQVFTACRRTPEPSRSDLSSSGSSSTSRIRSGFAGGPERTGCRASMGATAGKMRRTVVRLRARCQSQVRAYDAAPSRYTSRARVPSPLAFGCEERLEARLRTASVMPTPVSMTSRPRANLEFGVADRTASNGLVRSVESAALRASHRGH